MTTVLTDTSALQKELERLRKELERLSNQRKSLADQLDEIDKRIADAASKSKARKAGGTRPGAGAYKLADAVLRGEVIDVEKLLRSGVSPDSRSRTGEPALLLAVQVKDNLEITQMLLEAGAGVDARDSDENTPLIVSASDDRIDVVRVLLKHGADPNAQNKEGDTPLTNAACWGSTAVVGLLLKAGARRELRDGAGLTASDLARQQGHSALARRLAS